MAGTKEQRYKEFDVTLAVRWWLVPSGRNYGLVVEVEDTQGKCKASNRFFKSRNCSSIDGMSRVFVFIFFLLIIVILR